MQSNGRRTGSLFPVNKGNLQPNAPKERKERRKKLRKTRPDRPLSIYTKSWTKVHAGKGARSLPLYQRLPRWNLAMRGNFQKQFAYLNL